MNLVEVKDLKMHFKAPAGRKAVIKAVDGISFGIPGGSTFGIVGESGCGKSTTARVIIRLYKATAGEILFEGKNIVAATGQDAREVCREIQMVFQDPYASLNPRMTVAETIMDPLIIHKAGTPQERLARVDELMELVGLDPRFAKRYPHEFSGGQRQRIGIARALALNPKLVILDEPVSALDVSVQSQILNLLQSLQEEIGLTYLFISHNLSVVDYMCREIAVMYLGRIVEQMNRDELFRNPMHPYTQALISAIPTTDIHREKKKVALCGDIPSPSNPPPGCTFHTRCKRATEQCRQEAPPAAQVSDTHKVYCWNHDQ